MTLACSSSDNNMADLDKRQQKYVKKNLSDTIPRLVSSRPGENIGIFRTQIALNIVYLFVALFV